MIKRKPLTVGEFLAQRPFGPATPAGAARVARLSEEGRRRELRYRRAEAPLVAQLHSVGCEVSSVWDLVNRPDDYPEALPVLVRHLNRPYPPAIRDGIARALGVKGGLFAWDILRQQYVVEPDRSVKDGIAAALAAMVDREHLGDLLALLRDRSHGERRVMLLLGLQRLRDPRAEAALEELADDPDLRKQIAIILRKRRRRRTSE